jgi:4'-phosphopantetheinyl transferase
MPTRVDRIRAPRFARLASDVRRLPSPEPGVALYLARLPATIDEMLAACLADNERARFAALARPVDRVRYLARRLLLRDILARSFGLDAAGLRFACTRHGKPHLDDHPGLHFNASHAGDWLLVATRRAGPVGVDIEHVATMFDWRALLSRVCAPDEARACLAAADPRAQFFRLWTAKEAVLKAHGTGFAADPRAALANACWCAVGAPPGYAAALAVAR